MPRQYVKLSPEEKQARLAERREAKATAMALVPQEPPGLPGRPTLDIDLDQVVKLAEMQCTNKEIAAFLDISPSTLANRIKAHPDLGEAIERGRELGKVSLRRLQMKHAKREGGPAVNMTIHLSKHTLGQSDRPIEHNSTEINVSITNVGESIASKLDELRRRILGASEQPVALLPVIDAEFSETNSGERVEAVAECVAGGVAEHAPEGDAGRVHVEPVEG